MRLFIQCGPWLTVDFTTEPEPAEVAEDEAVSAIECVACMDSGDPCAFCGDEDVDIDR